MAYIEEKRRKYTVNGRTVSMNRSEYKLFKAMKAIGLNPEPQYKISLMTVDFAFPEEMMVIEVNGVYHNSDFQKATDSKRYQVLRSLGWKRRSYTADRAYKYPSTVAKSIARVLRKPTVAIQTIEEPKAPIAEATIGTFDLPVLNELIKNTPKKVLATLELKSEKIKEKYSFNDLLEARDKKVKILNENIKTLMKTRDLKVKKTNEMIKEWLVKTMGSFGTIFLILLIMIGLIAPFIGIVYAGII